MPQPSAGSLRQRREAVVREHIAAENTGDLDGLIASFSHPRYHVVPMDVVSDGEEAVRNLIGGVVQAFPDFHFEATVIHHADEAVIVEGRMTGTQEGEWAGIPPRRGRMDLPMVCVYNFDRDHLMNETVYFDFATVQRQLGTA